MDTKGKNFEIVRASAGSGKTYRLVLRYLECALQYENPRSFRRILALTFTNKAAAEMKSRILTDLEELVKGTSDKIEELEISLKLSQNEIVKRSERLHKEMLHRYSDISVMTIDKFVNKLVKSFARDLALEQDYRIEIESDKVLNDAVSILLDKLGTKENLDLTSLLESFALSRVDDDLEAGIKRPLTKLGKTLMQEKMKAVIDQLEETDPTRFKKISADLRKETSASEKKLNKLLDLAIDALAKSGIPHSDFHGNGGINKVLWDLRYVEIKDPTARLKSCSSDPNAFVVATAPQSSKAAAVPVQPFVKDVYDQLLKMRPSTVEGKRYVLAKNLNKRIALLGTLTALSNEVEEVQTSNNIRTFNAMHEKISAIVRNNSAPFIYERLGSRYNHIFMDEFQDTSVTQWHNLVVLYDHALANNHKTLVVGDGKQAIYRFRNGDYKQLMDLPNLQPGDHGPAISDAEEAFTREESANTLKDNYRTGRKIVEWNNQLFNAMKSFVSDDLKSVYDDLAQTPKKKFNGGVFLELAVNSKATPRREEATEKIISRIRHHEKEGYKRGDITILVRENKDGEQLAIDLLKEGITPMTEESLQLSRHPGPLALVSLMRWLIQPDDYRQSATLLQCASALSTVGTPIDEALMLDEFVVKEEKQGKRGKKGMFKTKEMLSHLFPDLDLVGRTSGPLAGFVGHVCEAMGITRHYSAYAEALIDLARKVGSTDESGIHGFLRVWDNGGDKQSIVTTCSENSVRIMTIHKAKGLAFKIVIALVPHKSIKTFKGLIPVEFEESHNVEVPSGMMEDSDMKDTILESQRLEEIDRVVLDNINTTYVAFTRPVERLDVILELGKLNYDEVKTMPQIILESIKKMTGIDAVAGNQTTDFSPPEKEELMPSTAKVLYPEKLVTGSKTSQLVIVPKGETASSQPDRMNPREMGSEVHRLLEELISAREWESVKAKFISSKKFSSADKDEICKRIEGVLNHPDAKQYFDIDLHVETEQSFVGTKGEILRPDRIVMSDGVWSVIDYKSSEDGAEKHKDQIHEYCQMLQEIEGSKVRGIIIYTDPLKVLEIV